MQIDYRLRRIAGLPAADPREATTAPPIKVETSLPTADEVEHTLPLAEGLVLEEGDTGTELAAWPRFESEDATIEIVGGVDRESEFLIEPVAVSEDGILVPTELDFDLVEDSEPEERGDVALVDALSFEIEAEETEVELPEVVEVEAPELEAVAEVEPEPAAEVEPELAAEVEPELAEEVEPDPVAEVEPEPESEASIDEEAEVKRPIGIASRPFNLSRLYATAEPEEAQAEPLVQLEPETEAEASTDPAPKADLVPELSLEPATKRERRRPQTMADLRPMSLAELIRQSEPRWTRLAEMD